MGPVAVLLVAVLLQVRGQTPAKVAVTTTAPPPATTTAATTAPPTTKALAATTTENIDIFAEEPLRPLSAENTVVSPRQNKAQISLQTDLGFVVVERWYSLETLSEPSEIGVIIDLTLPTDLQFVEAATVLRNGVRALFKGPFHHKYGAATTFYTDCLVASKGLAKQTLDLQLVLAQARRYTSSDERSESPLALKCETRTNQIPVIEEITTVSNMLAYLLIDIKTVEISMLTASGDEAELDKSVKDALITNVCTVQLHSSKLLGALIDTVEERVATLVSLANNMLPGSILFEVEMDCLEKVQREQSDVTSCRRLVDGYACSIAVRNRISLYPLARLSHASVRIYSTNLQLSHGVDKWMVNAGMDSTVDLADCTTRGSTITCPRDKELIPQVCLGAIKRGTLSAVLEHCEFEVVPDGEPQAIQVAGGTLITCRSEGPVCVTIGELQITKFPVLILHRQSILLEYANKSRLIEGNLAVTQESVHAQRFEDQGLIAIYNSIHGWGAWVDHNIPEHLRYYIFCAFGIVCILLAWLVMACCFCCGFKCRLGLCRLCCQLSKCCLKSGQPKTSKSKQQRPSVRFKAIEFDNSAEESDADRMRRGGPAIGSIDSMHEASSDNSSTDADNESHEMEIRPARQPRRHTNSV
jgi:hypothetical protein